MAQSPTRAAPSRRGIVKAVAALAAGIAAPAVLRVRAAYAAYPDRPIKFVVANTPGGPSDIVGRLVAAALQQSTGKTFIIENRGGAGGNLGMEYVAHSDPDGYTLLLGTTAFSVNYSLYNSLPFNSMKDFVAVSDVGGSPNIYLVKPDQPAKTMKDFVALARSSPEKFNASVPPIGTTPQLQMALLKVKEKLPNLEEVVFKGGGDAVEALLAGTVQICSGSVAPSVGHIKGGSLRGLAVCSEQRWPDLPDVPTMIEFGLSGFRLRHRCHAAGAGQVAARERQVAGDRNAQSPQLARDEGQDVSERLPGACQGRPGLLGAAHQRDGHVQADHRSGRNQEALRAP